MRRFKVFASEACEPADIEIVVNFVPVYSSSVAASDNVQLRRLTSIKKKYQYTPDQLDAYAAFLDSALSYIMSHRIELITHYQSNDSYAYYIKFYPLDETGNRYEEVTVVFRIGDHVIMHGGENREIAPGKTVFKNFYINGRTLENAMDVLDAIDHTCEELCKGNYAILFENS